MDCEYILLVQKWTKKRGFIHVGYMDKIFKSKQDAIEFYNTHNTHMRHLNVFGNETSDYDPKTRLRYRIISYEGEELDFPPFDN